MAEFKPFKVSVTIRDPESMQLFLEGLILAQSNNNSPYWRELIDGINAATERYRHEMIEEQRTVGPTG
jgi:hypothetical protein